MDPSRIARGGLFAVGLGVVLVSAGVWPKEQTVHYVLGDTSANVEELDARWARERDASGNFRGEDEWSREVTFRYAMGNAPRVVTHTPRLPNGDYMVEIELAGDRRERTILRRRVTLVGGVTQIDLDSHSRAEGTRGSVSR